MVNAIAWLLFALGIGHIAYGLFLFREALLDAAWAGFVGQFGAPEVRRTAFWFFVFGPLLMLAGNAALHAAAVADLALLKIIGVYVFVTAAFGVTAFPKSPFLIALLASPILVAAGYGWVS
jgi:hypothetical protein